MKKTFFILFISVGLSACSDKEVRLRDFPITRQAFEYSCGPSAVQAVMAYYGEEFRESELLPLLKTGKDDGTYTKDIVKFLHYQGLSTQLKYGMTTEELFRFIDKNIPVIVLIQAWGSEENFKNNYKECWDDGHFVVVIGYTDKNVLISDPALFTEGFIPVGEFRNRWHDLDEGQKTYQLGIAVYGKKPNFVEEKMERIK
ncbi:MAG: C39 family peptidase [Bacteroidetes bacterium]|nr:C39 family peptidase [Bacteroidota bacterium]